MYANLNTGVPRETNPSSLQGVSMKKVLLFLILGLASFGNAATPTNTITPSSTVTPSVTPTATKTNTPVAGYADGTSRVIVIPQDFTQGDGITVPSTTSLPGGTDIYLAQVISFTAAVFSTGTADARVQVTVPADYMRQGSLWLYALNSSLTNTVTVQANIQKVSFGQLTSTTKVYVGPATNVQTQLVGPLVNASYSRVWVPLSGTVGTYGTLKPGDLLNILITRSGTSGDLNVFAAEFEYKVNFPLRP